METEFQNTDPQRFISNGKPQVAELVSAFRDTRADLGHWIDQQRDNYNVRHCFWTGQHADGRKHGTKNNPAFPWENASDLRTFLVDQFITADVSLLCTALQKSNLAAVPVEGNDIQRSKLVSSFMRWMIFSQMQELSAETELLANYYLEKGIGVLGVFWDTHAVPEPVQISVEDIAEQAPELVQAIQDKEMAADMTDMLQAFYPNLSRREARKAVTALRNDGVATVQMPKVVWQRPIVQAYTPDKDIFIPMGTTDIQKAPFLFKQDWYSPDQLMEKVATEGWDENYVKHVINTQQSDSYSQEDNAEWDDKYGLEGNQKTENIPLVCAYYKISDENGLPATWYTVYHHDVSFIDGVDNPYAIHAQLDYSPARYPFVVFQRERLSRRLLETRGYPEILRGWQDQDKIECDSRIDRQSMTTNPPMLYPIGRKPDAWGPGAKQPYRRRDDYGWAETPTYDPGSVEIENNIMDRARKYFGRPTSELDSNEARTIQQFMVQKWLNDWKEVFRQVWSLFKQYGQDEQFFRVVGGSPDPQKMAKGDEHEKYDFYIEFDVPGVDPEYQLKKLESIAELATKYDRSGRTNWGALLGELIGGVDPVMSERILLPEEEASEKEVNEEKQLLTQMWAGMDVDLIPPYNHELRTQVFTNWINGSETIPATDVQARLQNDEAFRARVEKHQKQLTMQKMQEQNAITGVTGAPPGNL